MKKHSITFIICLLCALFSTSEEIFAQEPGSLVVGFETPMSLHKNKGLRTMEFTTDIGFNITKWLAISTKFDTTAGMFDIGGVKTYELTESVGARLKFKVLKTNYGVLSIDASGGSTVGGTDWKHTYYSGGCYFNMGKGKIKPALGAGVKYYDTSKKSNFENCMKLYFSFALWIG